ncbi:MAG TPA: class II fructose-1,6-bisphosphate aldolase [Tenericutes bacterium]|nr:class II fructose-1,6-bisphosphate aldolase [Mycoplasmatota bacterium]
MMLVNMRQILNNARNQKKAIAHFNINNLEWTKYILEEANKLNSPIILGVSESASKHMGGYETVYAIVKSLIKSLNITIDIVLHLDHGSSYSECVKAIDAGFTSVMIDASKHNLLDNIKVTKQVVDYAKQKNVSVEAEIGHIGGSEDGIEGQVLLADINDCIVFVKNTQIDCLAPAIGNAHGVYQGEPKLDFELLEQISKETNVPLVLHGGTGIKNSDIIRLIDKGITKININTELQISWSNSVREYINKNPDIYDPRKIIKSGEESLKKVVREKIELFENR